MEYALDSAGGQIYPVTLLQTPFNWLHAATASLSVVILNMATSFFFRLKFYYTQQQTFFTPSIPPQATHTPQMYNSPPSSHSPALTVIPTPYCSFLSHIAPFIQTFFFFLKKKQITILRVQ